jgi:hypothetical protein
MVKTAANPGGLPKEVVDGINADLLAFIKGDQAAVA